MKILVFGAGVLGCNLARNFFRAGKDVMLMARGAWGESIPKKRPRVRVSLRPADCRSSRPLPVPTGGRREDGGRT